jgi:hypothetical protein
MAENGSGQVTVLGRLARFESPEPRRNRRVPRIF